MMALISSVLTLLLCCACYLAPAQPVADDLVPVTYSYTSGKSQIWPKGRFELRYNGDSIELWAFDAPKALRLRKFKAANPSGKLTRSQMKQFAQASLESIYAALGDPAMEVKGRIPSPSVFHRDVDNYMSGTRSSLFISNQWIHLASLYAPGANPQVTSWRTKRFLRAPVYFRTALLPGAVAGKFPAIDPWDCVPAIERYFKLRKMGGYGLNSFKYSRYRTIERQNIRKEFELYFEKGEVAPDPHSFQEIASYLQQNQFVILHAEMSGATSVEGGIQTNKKLQAERARVVASALRKYADDPAKSDTVILSDGWTDFRAALRLTDVAFLDTLTNDKFLELLMTNADLRAKLEPLLAVQRKAKLKLVLAKHFSMDDKRERLRMDLARLSNRVFNANGAVNRETEAQIMGILETLLTWRMGNIASDEEVESILNQTACTEFLHILFAYRIMIAWEHASNKTWSLVYDDWFAKAKEQLIAMASTTLHHSQRRDYLRMCVDFQAHEGKLIFNGLIDASRACMVPYPEKAEFMGLILNQYALAQLISEQTGNTLDCTLSAGNAQENKQRDTLTITPEWLQDLRRDLGLKENILIGGRLFRKPTFDSNPKGPYYYLLKRRFLANDPSALRWFEHDDGRAVDLSAFNLYDLLAITLREWNPHENYFYDKDVQVAEMHRLITILKKSGSGICSPQLNDLLLSWHLKVLYYLESYAEPGNPLHRQLAEGSLAFIANYYEARAGKVNAALSLHVVKQLNRFNSLPGSRTGAWYGYEVLRAVAMRRMLNEEEMKLFETYLAMYDPRWKSPMPMLYLEQRTQERLAAAAR